MLEHGERPDTLHLQRVPNLMFRDAPTDRQPNGASVRKAFAAFGAVADVIVVPNHPAGGEH